MNVTLLGTLPPLRAISPYCLELARHLSPLVDLNVLTFRHLYPRALYPGGNLRDETLQACNNSAFTVRPVLNWYDPPGWWRAGRRIHADVLHVQHWSAPTAICLETVMRTASRHNTRCVLTLHNVLPHEPSHCYVPMTRRLCRLAHCCIVHCEANRCDAIEHLDVPADRIEVVPHGPLVSFAREALDGATARQRLGLAPGDPVVLFFGAIRPYKGVDVLLRAFADALERVPELKLVIAGHPWEPWQPYERMCKELGIGDAVIRRLQFIPGSDVNVLFHAADLVVLPYLRFGAQSGAGLTAIAFEKPLLVTSVGGLPDLQPEPSFVVPPGSPAALCDRMVRFFSQSGLRQKLRSHSRERASSMNWERIAAATLNIYEHVCRSSP